MTGLYLALSCFQGRPMSMAARDLLELAPDGLQLTPGNAPTRDFIAHLADDQIATCTHHGFCHLGLRRPVWSGVSLLTDADSVHPPEDVDFDDFVAEYIKGSYGDTAFEVMYPGELLGTGREVRAVMELGMPLAIDVSHLNIQLTQGVMGQNDWRAIQDYSQVVEVHVSANDGRRDLHRPVSGADFGLGWAGAKLADGVPVICESYMHRLDPPVRFEMVEGLRRALTGLRAGKMTSARRKGRLGVPLRSD